MLYPTWTFYRHYQLSWACQELIINYDIDLSSCSALRPLTKHRREKKPNTVRVFSGLKEMRVYLTQ